MIAATRPAKCLNFFLPRSFMNERARNREAFDDCDFFFFYSISIIIMTRRSLTNMTMLITAHSRLMLDPKFV